MLAREKDGKVEVNPPKVGTLSDGRVVSNYHRLPDDILAAEGWVPYIDEQPEFSPETQRVRATGYQVEEDSITRTYEVVERPEPEPYVSDEERIEALEDAVLDLLSGE